MPSYAYGIKLLTGRDILPAGRSIRALHGSPQRTVAGHTDHLTRSRIHERKISLMFLGIISRVLRVEVSFYYVYINKPVLNHFYSGGGEGGRKSVSRGDCKLQGGNLSQLHPRIRPLVCEVIWRGYRRPMHRRILRILPPKSGCVVGLLHPPHPLPHTISQV
jgi:hypothetical protein